MAREYKLASTVPLSSVVPLSPKRGEEKVATSSSPMNDSNRSNPIDQITTLLSRLIDVTLPNARPARVSIPMPPFALTPSPVTNRLHDLHHDDDEFMIKQIAKQLAAFNGIDFDGVSAISPSLSDNLQPVQLTLMEPIKARLRELYMQPVSTLCGSRYMTMLDIHIGLVKVTATETNGYY
jgi:hypothetical protein